MTPDKTDKKTGKGGRRPGSGRKPGSPNKATANAREAIALFIDANTGRLEEWLDRIAATDPKGAFQCLMDVMEYHIPKMQRTEVTGKDGGPVVVQASSEDEKL